MRRETIGYILYNDTIQDGGDPLVSITFTPFGELPDGKKVPWSAAEVRAKQALGFLPVMAVMADVERIGSKIHMSDYNGYLLEGLSEGFKLKLELILTRALFEQILDKFYADLKKRRQA
jgi:hypothetical protein